MAQESKLLPTFDLDTFLTSVSSSALILAWSTVTIFFATVYWTLSQIPGEGISPLSHESEVWRFLESLYYSITIGTTTGLGDIAPIGYSRFITAIQAIISFILLAAFVAKFAGRKQEKVLDDIHQLSFDSSFHSIRNGLFIARKDIDAIIKKVPTDGLTKKDWTNLKTALRQMQIFIKHIPDFYQKKKEKRDFDTDKEMLLIDSLERTLTRLVEALDHFKGHSVDFRAEAVVLKELESLLTNIDIMSLHEEKKTLDPENHESFQEILNRTEDIRQHLKELV